MKKRDEPQDPFEQEVASPVRSGENVTASLKNDDGTDQLRLLNSKSPYQRVTTVAKVFARDLRVFGSTGRQKSLDQSAQTATAGSGGLLFRSFVLLVLVPTAAAFLYFANVASDGFVSEAKLTVREAQQQSGGKDPMSVIGQLGIAKSSNTTQDAMIVLDYVKSRAVIEDIGGREKVTDIYSKENIDIFSRLKRGGDNEGIWEYWNSHVTASVDTLSSILTLRVKAYTPADALSLTNDIIGKSEQLINKIAQRSKEDALKRANDEVNLAAQSLAEARSNLLLFQQQNQTIDPTDTAKQILKLVSGLTVQRTEIENELATSASLGITSKPGEAQLKARLAAVVSQLEKLNGSLTGTASKSAISTQLRDFELLKLQEDFAEHIYKLARTGFEQARQNIERQQLYLAVVVPPSLPERALYPKTAADTALIFAGLLIMWGICSLVVASVKDSMT